MSRLPTVLWLLGESLLDGFLSYRRYEHLRTRRVPHSVALKAAMADRPRAQVITKEIMPARPAHA